MAVWSVWADQCVNVSSRNKLEQIDSSRMLPECMWAWKRGFGLELGREGGKKTITHLYVTDNTPNCSCSCSDTTLSVLNGVPFESGSPAEA
jgi:hypothetical protein